MNWEVSIKVRTGCASLIGVSDSVLYCALFEVQRKPFEPVQAPIRSDCSEHTLLFAMRAKDFHPCTIQFVRTAKNNRLSSRMYFTSPVSVYIPPPHSHDSSHLMVEKHQSESPQVCGMYC